VGWKADRLGSQRLLAKVSLDEAPRPSSASRSTFEEVVRAWESAEPGVY
jgi:hypothetical protein